MIYVENLVNAYSARSHANDWARWVKDNPQQAQMLAEAEAIAEGVI